MPKAVAQFTIRDDTDITVGVSAPPSPVKDQLWLDTSVIPSQMKRYNGSAWDVVNDIIIGGRNLLITSGCTHAPKYVKSSSSMVSLDLSINKSNNSYTFTCNSTTGEVYYRFINPNTTNLYGLDTNSYYTLSGYIRGKLYTSELRYRSESCNDKGSWVLQNDIKTLTGISETEYKFFSFTTKIPNNAYGHYISLQIYNPYYGAWFEIKDMKFEKGNAATDWTPAPEDVDKNINDIGSTVNKSVKTVDVMYYLSTSNTSLIGGSWSTTAPEWVDGKYMWSKTVTTFMDSSIPPRESEPTCIAGATGSTGNSFLTYTTNYNYDQYRINTYSAPGYTGIWTVNESTSKCKVGDTVNLRVYNNTKSCYSFITASVNSVGSNNLNTTSIALIENGNVGQGIVSITEEYYLSTSKSSQVGGQWSDTAPDWSTGMYMWTRSKITYNNPTAVSYTTPICDTSWEAVNNLQLGGRNLLFKTDTSVYGLGNWVNNGGVGVMEGTYGDGTPTIKITGSNGICTSGYVKLRGGSTFVYSMMMKSSGDITVGASTPLHMWLSTSTASGGHLEKVIATCGTIKANTWTKAWIVFQTPSNADTYYMRPFVYGIGGNTIYICKVKIEEGNMPTDWTPAPEDMNASTVAIDRRVSDTELALNKDNIVAKVTDVFTTKQESSILQNQLEQSKQNVRCNGLGAKINYSDFNTSNPGEIYLHGYDSYNNPIDSNGVIYWNGGTVTVPKGMLNPDGNCGIGNDVYIFMNVKNQSVVMGGWFDTSTKSFKYRYLIGGSTTGQFTPTLDHVALGLFNMKDAESFNYAFLFDSPQSLNNLVNGVGDIMTRLNNAELKIESDSIISTVTNSTYWNNLSGTANTALSNANSANSKIDSFQVGTRNFIKNSDYMLSATSSAFASNTTVSLVDGLDLNATFLGKDVVFSYFVNTPGSRTAGSGSLGNRFGIHGSVLWRNSSSGSTTVSYPFANCLEGSYDNQRVEMKVKLTPPSGYDMIQSFTFSSQPLARPASGNTATWKIGQPKLELGTKASDWSPAPEDVNKSISDAKTDAISSANNSTDEKLKGYATTSSVTQTAKDITYAFTSTGGCNLLKNSDANNGTSYWQDNGGGLSINTSGGSIFKGQTEFRSSFPSGMRYYQSILLKGDTDYVYEGWIYSPSNYAGSQNTPLHFWCMPTAETAGQSQCTIIDYRQELVAGDFSKVYVHFKTKTGTTYFKPFIYGGPTGTCSVHQLSLTEGKVERAWTPHPSEIYDGSTVIDASGVTIKNGDIRIQNKTGTTVLQGDTNGNLKLTGGGVYINDGSTSPVSGKPDVGGISTSASSTLAMYKDGLYTSSNVPSNVSSYYTLYTTNYRTDGVMITEDNSNNPAQDIFNTYLRGSGLYLYKKNKAGNHQLMAKMTSNEGLILNGSADISGTVTFSVPPIASNSYYKTTGNTGWLNDTHGGGWFMQDSTWVRVYGNKNVYTAGTIRGDSGFQLNAGNTTITTGSSNSAKISTPYGNVEIGPQNSTFLHIYTDRSGVIFNKHTYSAGNFELYNSSSNFIARNNYGYQIKDTNGTNRYVVYMDTGNNLVLGYNAERYITAYGHLTPYKTRSYWLGTNSPDLQWKGVCCEGGVVGASDIRRKENIERLDGTLVTYDDYNEEIKEYQLCNLRSTSRATSSDYYEFIKDRFKPSYYNYKLTEHEDADDLEARVEEGHVPTDKQEIDPESEYNMLKNIGFIAQDYDLENDKVAREFIIKGSDGILSYNHMSYVTVGMIALQEATKKIEVLENENLELKNRLDKLEELVKQLL